ncbi:MAG TPA: 2-dehydropantoate 2-reductase [Spirochaetaceae bacterium]|nr:2-dehydropantoate 2-reductase [Spirochaetaceae bacterium]
MKISIIGSGAMGSLFGGRLSLAGQEVVLYDVYREHVDAINASGLSIEDAATGEVTVVHPKASANPAAVAGSDVLIIFVKSTATAEAAAQFKSFAKPGTIALTLQNGLGNEEILRNYFGASGTAAGVTSQGATFLGPGKIRHAGKGPTHMAMSDGDSVKLAKLAEALSAAGFETYVDKDVANMVWSKLLINVGINALTGILNLKNGQLLDYEDVKSLMAGLVNEAIAVAKARGVRLSYEDPVATVYDVALKTGANTSSMLQDFQKNRQSEIDFMNGAIVREAQALGIPVPLNDAMTRLVRTMDRIHTAKGA